MIAVSAFTYSDIPQGTVQGSGPVRRHVAVTLQMYMADCCSCLYESHYGDYSNCFFFCQEFILKFIFFICFMAYYLLFSFLFSFKLYKYSFCEAANCGFTIGTSYIRQQIFVLFFPFPFNSVLNRIAGSIFFSSLCQLERKHFIHDFIFKMPGRILGQQCFKLP